MEMSIDKKVLNKAIGAYCKNFRINVMKKEQQEFADILGVNVQNISAFEHGRSGSIQYMFMYHSMLPIQLQSAFITGLFNTKDNLMEEGE